MADGNERSTASLIATDSAWMDSASQATTVGRASYRCIDAGRDRPSG